eukprot:Skav212237  [mRNA]  locus=scaffold4106:52718:52960:+ [translate_table: standard]
MAVVDLRQESHAMSLVTAAVGGQSSLWNPPRAQSASLHAMAWRTVSLLLATLSLAEEASPLPCGEITSCQECFSNGCFGW